MSPSPQSLIPAFKLFGLSFFPYRHPERSRGIFLALRLVSHKHWQGNDVLVLRISLRSHMHRLSVCKEDFSLRSK